LSRWFEALGKLNHWATSLQELYVQAAHCAVEAIGLDGAMVCRLRDGQWEIAASHLPNPDLGIHFDPPILDELLALPATLFHSNSVTQAPRTKTSKPMPPAVVLSPLRNSTGSVVGSIYGYRSVRAGNARRGIRYLEAHWIELLAGAVSDAMLRLERESQIDRRRVLLERTSTNAGSRERRAMTAETRVVTLLFADLRDFTRRSETLEMDVVYELLGQVMDVLSAAVMDHDGLILDYYGDGLAAMWNAPADQADHAELACRAALRMLESMPELARDWGAMLDGPLQLGVGVHSGPARVGNAGSRHRTKYGPRGANVNLTSRVEAATKEIGIPFLASGAVAAQLSNQLATHRVCSARVPGMEAAVDLFSVQSPRAAQRVGAAWQNYDQALRHFEAGDFLAADQIIATLELAARDIPVRFLAEQIHRELGRIQNRRSSDRVRKPVSGVITLSAK
jgi:adenylate cyclase